MFFNPIDIAEAELQENSADSQIQQEGNKTFV